MNLLTKSFSFDQSFLGEKFGHSWPPEFHVAVSLQWTERDKKRFKVQSNLHVQCDHLL